MLGAGTWDNSVGRATGWQLGGYTGDEGLGQAEQELWKGQRSWKTNRQVWPLTHSGGQGRERGPT